MIAVVICVGWDMEGAGVIRWGWRPKTGRVGVVVITLASHARGREFNPRIRYFFLRVSFVSIVFILFDFFLIFHCFGSASLPAT